MNFTPTLKFAKPCPFCQHQTPIADDNETKHIKSKWFGFRLKYVFVCPCCGAEGPASATKKGAFCFWETRSNPKIDVKSEDGSFANKVYAQALEFAKRPPLKNPDGTTTYYTSGLSERVKEELDWSKLKAGDTIEVFTTNFKIKT